MKKLIIISAFFLFTGIAFGQTNASDKIDIEAEKTMIIELMDQIDAGFKNGDGTVFRSSFADDALICGTDPSEFWTKEQFLGGEDQESDNTMPEFNYIDDRVVKVAPDGNSAIVVTQYIIEWSPKIPWRMVYHFIKTDEGWKVYFMNVAFVPKNEDIETINKAIQ